LRFMGFMRLCANAQALGKGGWSAASLFAGSMLIRIEQRGQKSGGVAKRSLKRVF
jgi:hypothetical protein